MRARRSTNAIATSTKPRPIIDVPPVAAVVLSADVAPDVPSPLPPAVVGVAPAVGGVTPAVVGGAVVVPLDDDEDAVDPEESVPALPLELAVDDEPADDDVVGFVVGVVGLTDVGVAPLDVDVSSRSPGFVMARTTPMARTMSAAAPSTLVVRRFRALSSLVRGRSSWLERATGIEPASSDWKSEALPLSYARKPGRG
ncbi:MAG: hypothetical protein QOE63_760 [Acidimicrobiaceae bacterium]